VCGAAALARIVDRGCSTSPPSIPYAPPDTTAASRFSLRPSRLRALIAQAVRRTVGKWVGETYRRLPMIVPMVIEI
jgi:ribonuclease J